MEENFKTELNLWKHKPQQDPSQIISTFRDNDITYMVTVLSTDSPIDYFKKIFLPNHLSWFLLEPEYLEKLYEAQQETNPYKYFLKLINATINMYLIEKELYQLNTRQLDTNLQENFSLMQNLLEQEFIFEVERIAYNSHLKDFIRNYISKSKFSLSEQANLFVPSYGTIFNYLAQEGYKKSIKEISLDFFGGSIKDATNKTKGLEIYNNKRDLKNEQEYLERERNIKKEIFQKDNNLMYIDGLITFDKLIDKLIVYSGLLRHSVFSKKILLQHLKKNMTDAEIFKTKTKDLKKIL